MINHSKWWAWLKDYRDRIKYVVTKLPSLHLTELNYHHQASKADVHHTPRCKKKIKVEK